MNTTTGLHGDRAMVETLEPQPAKRYGIRGFTIKRPPKPPVVVVTPRGPRPPKAPRVVEGIPVVLGPRPKRSAAPPRTGTGGLLVDAREFVKVENQAPERVYGAEPIIGALARAGVSLILSTDRQYLIPIAPGGRIMQSERELLEASGPLLLAHMRATPLVCVVPSHPKDADPTAVTLLAGGAPACLVCLRARG